MTLLGELGAFRNGVNFSREDEGRGLPVLKVKDFGNLTAVPSSGLDELDPARVRPAPDQLLEPGDTVIIRSNGNIDLVGRSLLVTQAMSRSTTFSGFCIRFRPDRRLVDPRYAFYVIRSQNTRRYFSSYGYGTGIQNLNQDILAKVPFWRPSLPEQHAIASILGALDDKIELNRRMNETLEAMARAIFKSWFVDFEPVRAKMEGRRPMGMDADTAALFPSRMVQSEMGEVPEGWVVRPLDDVATFLNGLALQKYPPRSDDTLPVIKIAEMKNGITAKTDRADAGIPAQYVIRDGDVLFSWSGSLTVVVWSGGLGALNQHLFKVSSSEYPKWFYLGWVQHHLPEFQAIAADKATTMGHIQRHHLTRAKVVCPEPSLMNRASATLGPLVDLRVSRDLESAWLARMRDELLPRLLSGELRVRDAERLVEAHV
ncbi:MAG: restriction endonuclease subunit S [Polyangiales bacterium]